MIVSHQAALQLKMCRGRLGELVERTREDIPVHSEVRVIGAEVVKDFHMSPTELGGGVATAEIVV